MVDIVVVTIVKSSNSQSGVKQDTNQSVPITVQLKTRQYSVAGTCWSLL